MTKEFIKKMELQLKEEQKKLRLELETFAKKNNLKTDDYDARFPDYGDKEDDNAAEVATFQDNLSLESDLEKNLAEVDHALTRIEAGTYGNCEKCNKKIEQARLEAFPAAVTCVNCGDKI